MSASLYLSNLSLHLLGSLCECRFLRVVFSSFNFSVLTHSCFFSLLISLTCFLSPGFFSQPSVPFLFGERLGELLLRCFTSEKQCDHSQVTNSLNFRFFPHKIRIMIPFYNLLPWASLRTIQWDSNSNTNGCHCWDLLYIRYIISITSLMSQIFYMEDGNHYIPPFYPGVSWESKWSYPMLHNWTCIQTYVLAMVFAWHSDNKVTLIKTLGKYTVCYNDRYTLTRIANCIFSVSFPNPGWKFASKENEDLARNPEGKKLAEQFPGGTSLQTVQERLQNSYSPLEELSGCEFIGRMALHSAPWCSGLALWFFQK